MNGLKDYVLACEMFSVPAVPYPPVDERLLRVWSLSIQEVVHSAVDPLLQERKVRPHPHVIIVDDPQRGISARTVLKLCPSSRTFLGIESPLTPRCKSQNKSK